MPGLTYTLKADGTPLEKGLNSAKQSVGKFQNDVSAMEKKAAREREALSKAAEKSARINSMKVGMGAMQVQDIAVQLQGGARLGTVIAQQGTQILSMFGPGGAIAGAILGVGAGLVTAFMSGTDAVKELKKETNDLAAEMNKATIIGTGEAFKNFSTKAVEEIDKIKGKLDEFRVPGRMESFLQLIPGAGTAASAGMRDNREVARQQHEASLLETRIKLTNATNEILDSEEKQLEILRLKANGDEKGARALENELKMNAELGEMFASQLAINSTAYAMQQDANIREKFALQEKIQLLGEEKKAREKTAKAVDELLESIDKDLEAAEKRREKAKEKRLKDEADVKKQIEASMDADAEWAAEKTKRDNDKQEKKLKQIEDERKAREDADKDAQDRIDKVQEKMRTEVESRLTLEQKIALAKERVAKAQEKAQAFRNVGINNKAAEADLAEAQAGLMDVREQKIQRIMKGSTSAAKAARQDKRDARARARAERIHDKREAIKEHDAKARGEKRDAVKKGGALDMKGKDQEQITLLGNIEQQLKDLNTKLTVA